MDDNYQYQRNIEHQRHAIASLNNALGWCKQVDLVLEITEKKKQVVIKSKQLILLDNGELALKED